MWRRNVIVLCTAALVIVALTFLVHFIREPLHRSFDSAQWLAAVFFVFCCIAVGSFLNLRGRFWIRMVLVAFLPPFLSLLAEIVGYSDPDYPGLGFMVGVVLGVVSFLACVLICGPIYVWRKHKREAT